MKTVLCDGLNDAAQQLIVVDSVYLSQIKKDFNRLLQLLQNINVLVCNYIINMACITHVLLNVSG